MSDNSQVVHGVQAGDVLASRYRVREAPRRLGRSVFAAAHDLETDERVTIQFLVPYAAGGDRETANLRTAREAALAAQLLKNAEHIARVREVRALPDGAPCLVMDPLEGEDLAEWLKRRGPLPIEQAVEFIRQACVAVAHAHARGIVHWALQPANLLCALQPGGERSIQVLNFGIVRVTDSYGTLGELSLADAIDVASHMSPEQIQSRHSGSETDIWALGASLFELLTGNSPFFANSVPNLLLEILSSPPRSLRVMRPEVPVALEEVILKCLQKDPALRFGDAGELALALLPFASKRGVASAPIPAPRASRTGTVRRVIAALRAVLRRA